MQVKIGNYEAKFRNATLRELRSLSDDGDDIEAMLGLIEEVTVDGVPIDLLDVEIETINAILLERQRMMQNPKLLRDFLVSQK